MPQDLIIDVNAATHVHPFRRETLGYAPGSLLLTVESSNIRFWYGGTTPTASSGHLLNAGGSLVFTKTAEIENLKMIATTGTARIYATVGGS